MGRLPDFYLEVRARRADPELMIAGTLEENGARREVRLFDLHRRRAPSRLRTATMLFDGVVIVEEELPEDRFPRRYWAHDPNLPGRSVGG